MAVFAENKKAGFNFEILEKFQGGLVLRGAEVKSVMQGKMQLAGSYITLRKGELWLLGSTVSPYQPNNPTARFPQERARKVLVTKRELGTLFGKTQERGLTLVPLKVYSTAAGKLKLEFALSRHKKRWDKRETLKNKEAEREMRRFVRG